MIARGQGEAARSEGRPLYPSWGFWGDSWESNGALLPLGSHGVGSSMGLDPAAAERAGSFNSTSQRLLPDKVCIYGRKQLFATCTFIA